MSPSPVFAVRPLADVATDLQIRPDELVMYGRDKGKLAPSTRGARRRDGQARLVLVSAITPTPAGEGKTTTTIGLGDALRRRGQSVCVALREPSLGPCFGSKGGGTGGGRSQLVPAIDINLHFTGDFHAVTAAHNLLASAVDNMIQRGNPLGLDPRRTVWRRVMDANDRALRNIITGLGGPEDGVPREAGFDITAASEVMAMLCLCESAEDLRARFERTLVGFTFDDHPVLAKQLKVTGAMLALLRDALHPNLVQTMEGTPALVHGGPFANIAHGTSSVLATRTGLALADWVVTEAGFGFDLGAEKFFDIKCATAGLEVAAVVLVATVRALKLHGGAKLSDLARPDPAAVARGLPNLDKHIENIACFGAHPVVALNRFGTDSQDELAVVERRLGELGVPVAVCDHFSRGGVGAEALAALVEAHAAPPGTERFKPLYDWKSPVPDKIKTVASKMYGARDVLYSREARQDLKLVERHGFADLPVCIAKTQSSLSDDPRRRGRPRDFEVTVRRIHVSSGAGFLVVVTGDIVRMPGLPEVPRAEGIDLVDGEIVGLVL
ncbi:MAG: formate--tetrahydrofolate ligase [Deltaproteobacteria bacterium]|nr:formate--tetrahydrofolate ligase [Deltaproteobacteria bacterium]